MKLKSGVVIHRGFNSLLIEVRCDISKITFLSIFARRMNQMYSQCCATFGQEHLPLFPFSNHLKSRSATTSDPLHKGCFQKICKLYSFVE